MTEGQLRNEIIKRNLTEYIRMNHELSLYQQVNDMDKDYLKKYFSHYIPIGEVLEDEKE